MKNLLLPFLFSSILIACAQAHISSSLEQQLLSAQKQQQESFTSDSLIFRIGKLFTQEKESAIVLKRTNSENDFLLLIFNDLVNMKATTIDTIQIGIFLEIEIIDLNNNGLKDIIIHTGSNRPCNYIYLNIDSSFIIADDCTKWPEIKKLGNKEYAYTYRNEGCASSNWSSTLVIVNKHEIQKHATLTVRVCNEDNLNITTFSNNGAVNEVLNYKYSELEEKLNDLPAFWNFFIENKKSNYNK